MERFNQKYKSAHLPAAFVWLLRLSVCYICIFTLSAYATLPGFKPYAHNLDELVNAVHQDSLLCYVRQLSGEAYVNIDGTACLIQERNAGNAGSLAAAYLSQKLQQYNLVVSQQPFDQDGMNIFAEQSGYLYPNRKYIICAHYDDRPWDHVKAPGADDNASGCAAVIEAARLLTQYAFPYTIVYAFWDYEEHGLLGSQYYATQAAAQDDSICAVFNLDMIGYDGNSDYRCNIFYNNDANSDLLAAHIVDLQEEYGLGLITDTVFQNHYGYSDHASFWRAGYRAILLIEDYMGGDFNPHYHAPTDRVCYFNQSFFMRCSQLAVLMLADYARYAPREIEFDLRKGWNLVSLPGVAPSMLAESLFVDLAEGTIMTWENADYICADTLETGKGYFVFSPSAQTCTLSLTPVSTYLLNPTQRGWQLVGSVYRDVSSTHFISVPANSFIPSFFTYDPHTSSYRWQQRIDTGKGYWLFALSPAEIYLQTSIGPNRVNKSSSPDRIPALPPLPLVAEKAVVAHSAILLDSYPNPFNSSTTIRCVLPRQEHVRIDLFNLRGKLVTTLYNSAAPAGTTTLTWNGLDHRGQQVSSGLYIVQIKAGEVRKTHKISVIH